MDFSSGRKGLGRVVQQPGSAGLSFCTRVCVYQFIMGMPHAQLAASLSSRRTENLLDLLAGLGIRRLGSVMWCLRLRRGTPAYAFSFFWDLDEGGGCALGFRGERLAPALTKNDLVLSLCT